MNRKLDFSEIKRRCNSLSSEKMKELHDHIKETFPDLEDFPLLSYQYDEKDLGLIESMLSMSDICREGGLLALEGYIEYYKLNKFEMMLFKMLIDGSSFEEIKTEVEKLSIAIEYSDARRLNLILHGIFFIQHVIISPYMRVFFCVEIPAYQKQIFDVEVRTKGLSQADLDRLIGI